MKKIDKLNKELSLLKTQCILKEEEINAYLSRYTFLTCKGYSRNSGCGKKFSIGSSVFLQEEWYEEPSGCIGGDRWRDGSEYALCPKCSYHILIEDKILQKRPSLFKKKMYIRNEIIKRKSVYEK